VICRTVYILCIAGVLCWPAAAIGEQTGNTCNQCHPGQRSGFAEAHSFARDDCTICHGGNRTGTTKDESHAGMTGFPGNLENAATACGVCHAEQVASVRDSLMHTGRGIVQTTRKIVDGTAGGATNANFQSLGHGAAASMLRKLCASCHLGQNKAAHKLDPVSDRGGGCLACHINSYPANAHPALTKDVSDARCFGCHSRSARISLSYTGLAEIDPGSASQRDARLRLPDGRHVERKPADVHYSSGMRCVTCHLGSDLMSGAGAALHQRDTVDAQCVDCHSFDSAPGKPHGPEHARLECATCHSQWAPQCFGCHMEYDADGSQWDHIERRETAGRWHEQRFDFRNELGALGINADDRIELFVPGMIMTLQHPDWDDSKFLRVFAPISPHTIGPARSCESCHRSSVALGLGQGTLEYRDNDIHFEPRYPPLQDGLPADAWTSVDGKTGGQAPRAGQRPLNREEMEAVLAAPIP
jgi:predicted CXXCH cytochrome family protein